MREKSIIIPYDTILSVAFKTFKLKLWFPVAQNYRLYSIKTVYAPWLKLWNISCPVYILFVFNDQDQNERLPSAGRLQKNRNRNLVSDRDAVTDVAAIATIRGDIITVVHDVDQHIVATYTIAVVTARERRRCRLGVFGKWPFFGVLVGRNNTRAAAHAESGHLRRQSQDQNKDAPATVPGRGHNERHRWFVLRQVTIRLHPNRVRKKNKKKSCVRGLSAVGSRVACVVYANNYYLLVFIFIIHIIYIHFYQIKCSIYT